MNQMISVASGFQYSVNIGYDLNSDDKLQNFIPTKPALDFIEEILDSTKKTSTSRARILIGAYGKGKSHIVLTVLSLLMKKDRALFAKLMRSIGELPVLKQMVDNYYDSENKILPVVITGSNTSMTQAFLLALQRTLSDRDMLDIMPDSNYKAAVRTIEKWRVEFPDTYQRFQETIDESVEAFIERLEEYDINAYELFERTYPKLTSGSIFNPFLGFDVVELYENVAIALKKKGFTGFYVVYDEFSKYLEANITDASVSDVKMLQDFAEKCNRSGEMQMHLLLISHKEIANYIDKLPKQKVDGWRGVSERFKHIYLEDNFAQTYEIISSVIQKNKNEWNTFCEKYAEEFSLLKQRYEKHMIFSGEENSLDTAIYGCYPLHPVSTFILPRLSEKVAQNERTLFTFLSAEGKSTLRSFLDETDNSEFRIITPDLMYDYFEPLLKKEAYGNEIYKIYVLTKTIVSNLQGDELEAKLVKTIALIYILEQFERIAPTVEEVVGIFSTKYTIDEIQAALKNLIEQKHIVYLKRSNGFLRLKQTSGIDIRKKISDLMQLQGQNISIKDILNEANFDNYMYPSRYNDEREMTRYFSFEFIGGDMLFDDVDWNGKSRQIQADGIVYAVIPDDEEQIPVIIERILKLSVNVEQSVFIVPKHYIEIESVVREFNAVSLLKNEALNDSILLDEYDVIFEDLNDIVKSFVNVYTHPEAGKAKYFYSGKNVDIHRKAMLTELLSKICDTSYSKTPIINNEVINRHELTPVATNSRNKIIAALLRSELEVNLGFSGSGQEVSIMRSTLLRTGILQENNGLVSLSLVPIDENLKHLLQRIEKFILQANEKTSFEELYDVLISPKYHIGLRRGLIPIFLAVVLHKYKQSIVISNDYGQVPVTVDALLQINAEPKGYYLSYVEWDEEKMLALQHLEENFKEYVIEAEKYNNVYDYIANAMRRWYMALPKYSKDCKVDANGKKINIEYRNALNILRQNISGYELLFNKLPKVFCDSSDIVYSVIGMKRCYDGLIRELQKYLINETKSLLVLDSTSNQLERMSLSSVCAEWCEGLDQKVFEQIFSNGTEKFLDVLQSATNDEVLLVEDLGRVCTGLRLNDWADNTVDSYLETMNTYKKTAEDFQTETIDSESAVTTSYRITFVDDNGDATTRRFDRVEHTARGQLLKNQILASLDSMGRAVSELEKRQVLIEILKQLL